LRLLPLQLHNPRARTSFLRAHTRQDVVSEANGGGVAGMVKGVLERVGGLRKVRWCANHSGKPDLVLICLHGYGAHSGDLFPIGEQLMRALPASSSSSSSASSTTSGRIRCFFPQAPLDLSGGGGGGGQSYAWFPLDLQRLLQVAMTQGVGALFQESEASPEVVRARVLLSELVEGVRAAFALPYTRMVLAGFSQGAWLANDLAFRLPGSPAALVTWSGVLFLREEWAQRAPARAGLRVLQSHGTAESLLPFALGQTLRRFYEEYRLAVDFLSFPGTHTVPPEAVRRLLQLLRELS
jgi:phospholipase/carboxylesterase